MRITAIEIDGHKNTFRVEKGVGELRVYHLVGLEHRKVTLFGITTANFDVYNAQLKNLVSAITGIDKTQLTPVHLAEMNQILSQLMWTI